MSYRFGRALTVHALGACKPASSLSVPHCASMPREVTARTHAILRGTLLALGCPPMPTHSPSTVVSATRSRTNAKRGALLRCLLLRIGALWIAGCSAEHTEIEGFDSSEANFDSHAAGGGGAAAADATKPGSVCESGTVTECKVQLAPQGDVSNCFVGLQVCTNEVWSECLSESEAEERLAASGD